jgi:phospholipid/cholesterol/gamma-HCH transport system ATP-binding protein
MIMALQRDLKVTSVVVTHDMRTAFTVADRMAMLHDRRFPFVGVPDELARSEEPTIREFIAEALEELEDGARAEAGGTQPAPPTVEIR